jgi:hypothetical protein
MRLVALGALPAMLIASAVSSLWQAGAWDGWSSRWMNGPSGGNIFGYANRKSHRLRDKSTVEGS